MHILRITGLACCLLLLAGCATIHIGHDTAKPLKETVLEGDAQERVLLVPIRGVIMSGPAESPLGDHFGIVQETVAQLDKAAEDKRIKAVVLVINSPGGSVVASENIYREILRYRKKSGAKVVACMQEVAASGGYLVSLAADRIVAQEGTITGSVGAVYLRPRFVGLMDKLGIDVDVTKSGRNKDMGSPFRPSTDEEQQLFAELIGQMGADFQAQVRQHRPQVASFMDEIATARIYTGQQAWVRGLVDEVGDLRQAIATARNLAGLPASASVVAYRRATFADDNPYNPLVGTEMPAPKPLLDLGALGRLVGQPAGVYFLWMPQ